MLISRHAYQEITLSRRFRSAPILKELKKNANIIIITDERLKKLLALRK
jgi:hypothetical protein